MYITLIIILALAGLMDAGYLIYKHQIKTPLACPLKGECQAVVESKWSTTLGLRNDVLGLVYYAVVLLLALIWLIQPDYQAIIKIILLVITGGSFLFSMYLTYLQKYVIKAFCLYCLFSAGIATALFVVSWLWQRS